MRKWFGVSDDAADVAAAEFDATVDIVDSVMHCGDRERGIDAAMVIDDETGHGLSHPNIVNFANDVAGGGCRLKVGLDRSDHNAWRVLPGELASLQRFNMRFYFRIGPEFVSDGRFEPGRRVVSGDVRHAGVELEIQRNRAAAVDFL